MEKIMNTRIALRVFLTLAAFVFAPANIFSQAEKLGIVQYSPVSGWTKTSRDNIVAFSDLNQTAGTYCIITLYGATPGTGSPNGDFTREWNNLVLKTMKAEANPKTDAQAGDGWTAISGGSEVESDVGKAVGFLTVISGFGKTVSILAVFNDPAYVKQVDAFIGAIEMDKGVAVEPPPMTTNADGKIDIPVPTRQLVIGDLAGEWGETAGFSTTYVDRYTGAYRGTDSLHYRSKMTFTKNGGYLNDFFAIQNGKKIIDKTSGTVTIVGRVLSIKQHNTAKYVIRGWLELADMTILTVCGPWYDDDVIPEKIFTTPEQGANLNKNWIRKK